MKLTILVLLLTTLAACDKSCSINNSNSGNNTENDTTTDDSNGDNADSSENNDNNGPKPSSSSSIFESLKDVDKNHLANNINSNLDNMSKEEIEAKDKDNNSIWHLLAQDNDIGRNISTIKKLINITTKDISSKNNSGETPLDIMIKNKFFNNENTLKEMLDNGAKTSFDLQEYLSKNNSRLLQSVILTEQDLKDYLNNKNYLKELIESNNLTNHQISNFYHHIKTKLDENARKLLVNKLLENYKDNENYKKIIGEYKDIEPNDYYEKNLKKMFLNILSDKSADIYEDFANKADHLVKVLEPIASKIKQEKLEEQRRIKQQEEAEKQEELKRAAAIKKANEEAEKKAEKLTQFQNGMEKLFEEILNEKKYTYTTTNKYGTEEYSISNKSLNDKIKELLPLNIYNIYPDTSSLNEFYKKYINLGYYTNKMLKNIEKAKAFAQDKANKDFITKFNENHTKLNNEQSKKNNLVYDRYNAITNKIFQKQNIILQNKQNNDLRYTDDPYLGIKFSFTSFLEDNKTDYFTFTNNEIEEQLNDESKIALEKIGLITINNDIEALKKEKNELIDEGNLKDNFKEWKNNLYYATKFDDRINNIKEKLNEKNQAYEDFKKAFNDLTDNLKKQLEQTYK